MLQLFVSIGEFFDKFVKYALNFLCYNNESLICFGGPVFFKKIKNFLHSRPLFVDILIGISNDAAKSVHVLPV